MTEYNIKEMVQKGKKAKLQFYKQGELWYKLDNGLEFPVPTEDLGGSLTNAEEPAIFLMRWIRKHVAFIEKSKKEGAPID